MSSDLSLTKTELGTSTPTWVGKWPPEDTQSITLDADLCLALYTDGIVPDGAVLGELTARPGVYGPYGGISDEVQSVTVGGSGLTSFTLTFSGQTTASIDDQADGEDVQAALEALSNIGVGDVEVTGPAGGPWIVRFGGALADTNVAQMTSTPTGGTGTVTVATTTAGGAEIANDGRQTAKGLLLVPRIIRAGFDVPGALFYRGRVHEDRLPANSGLDPAAKADLTLIRFDRLGA